MIRDILLAALMIAVVLLAAREVRITRRERRDLQLEREQTRIERKHADELAMRRLKSLLDAALPPTAPAIPLGSDEPTVAEQKAPR